MDIKCGAVTKDPATTAPSKVRIQRKVEASPMILERLTAWTLVIVYYTVTCGAILLGLKGAL
jgi:hypothetical protein